MAKPNSSRGIGYNFPAEKFRNAIRFVFEMAAPPEDDIGILFHFAETVTFPGRGDGDKVPFDPRQAPTRTVKTPVSVPCQVDFQSAGDAPTSFGTVIPAKLTVLLLDGDYELVSDASFVTMNGDKYVRQYEPPSFGLFDVGLHEMVFVAENEL